MTTYSNILRSIAARGKGATGHDLYRMTYTGRMAGSQWRTLAGHMIEAQGGVCAWCGGDDLKRTRAANPEAIAMGTLLGAKWFGTEAARNSLTTGTGKPIDAYRHGWIEGNVVAGHVDCARMVRGEDATEARMAITAEQILMTWTSEMTRKAKPLKPRTSDSQRRALQARGWTANG